MSSHSHATVPSAATSPPSTTPPVTGTCPRCGSSCPTRPLACPSAPPSSAPGWSSRALPPELSWELARCPAHGAARVRGLAVAVAGASWGVELPLRQRTELES